MNITCKICDFSADEIGFRNIIADCHFLPIKINRKECPRCGVVFGTLDYLNMSEEELGNEYKKLFATGYVDFDY